MKCFEHAVVSGRALGLARYNGLELRKKGSVSTQDGKLEGTINKAEVMFAISLWYSVLDAPQEDGSSCKVS